MTSLFGLLFLIFVLLAAVALTAFAIRSVKRDARHGLSGSLSSAMLEVQSLLEPARKHEAHAVRAEEGEGREGEGEPPPDPGAWLAKSAEIARQLDAQGVSDEVIERDFNEYRKRRRQ